MGRKRGKEGRRRERDERERRERREGRKEGGREGRRKEEEKEGEKRGRSEISSKKLSNGSLRTGSCLGYGERERKRRRAFPNSFPFSFTISLVRWASIPSKKSNNTPSHASCYRNRDKLRRCGPLGSCARLTFTQEKPLAPSAGVSHTKLIIHNPSPTKKRHEKKNTDI